MINNLSQFKKAIAEHKEYIIIKHFVKPACEGQRRVPTKVQTNAYYSVIPDEPEHEVSKANGGLGYFNTYGKAKQWEFDGDLITQYRDDDHNYPIQTIRFVDDDFTQEEIKF